MTTTTMQQDATAAKAAQDAKTAEDKAAQEAKAAEVKAAEEAKAKAEFADMQEWVAKAMISSHQADHPQPLDAIDPASSMTAAREFIAAFKAMGTYKSKDAPKDAPAGLFGGLMGHAPGHVPFDGALKSSAAPAPITGLSGVVNANVNTVTLKWDAPAPTTRPGTADAPANEVAVYDGDKLISSVKGGITTYTTGMMTPGSYVFTVAAKDSAGRIGPRSNAWSAIITAAPPGAPPISPVAPPAPAKPPVG
jgi:hypothetical protein